MGVEGQLLLPADGILHALALHIEGMGAAGLLVAAHKGLYVRVHIEHPAAAAQTCEVLNGLEKLLKAALFPYVRHQRHFFVAALCGKTELSKAGHQRKGHVVHAVIVQILQHVGGAAFPCAGQACDYKKIHSISPLMGLKGSSFMTQAPSYAALRQFTLKGAGLCKANDLEVLAFVL